MALPEPTAERPEALPRSPEGMEKTMTIPEQEPAILTDGTTHWTGKQETFRVLSMIETRMLGRMKDGDSNKRVLDGIQKPQCKICGCATSYILEPVVEIKHEFRKSDYRPVKALVGLLLNTSKACVYLNEEKTAIYIPVTLCHKCSGSKDGYHDGKFEPHRKSETLDRLDTASLTHSEKQQYREGYEISFKKGQQKREEWDEENPKKRGRRRYMESNQ